jgi:hypothetical protein
MQLFLAQQGQETVGRIAAVINEAHDSFYHEHAGFFGLFECMPEAASAATALLQATESWVRERGATFLRGPVNLSMNELECGLLVEGFGASPVFQAPYNPPYYADFIEANGFSKCKDLLAFYRHYHPWPSARILQLVDRLQARRRLTIRPLNMRDFQAEVARIMDIYNDAWSDNWGFVPFTQAEIDHASKAFGPVIVPELAVFVEVDDEAVAFIVALTNLYEAVEDFNGRLGPLNLVKLLWRLKIAGVGSTRVPLMGVKKKFRNHPLMGAGLAMMAIDQLRQNGKRLGKTSAELGWILEDNKATNNIIRSVGGVHYKTHRLYEKAL